VVATSTRRSPTAGTEAAPDCPDHHDALVHRDTARVTPDLASWGQTGCSLLSTGRVLR
jgi:hypothetical protein